VTLFFCSPYFVLADNISLAELIIPVPSENIVTEPKRVLGKILFWDEQLSSDNTVACGSCHKPHVGGAEENPALHPGPDNIWDTDDDIIGSAGIRQYNNEMLLENNPHFNYKAQVTGRSSPSNINAMFSPTLFWDGRAIEVFIDPQNPVDVLIEKNGALESQAIGPILSSIEMAKLGRTWQDVIDKLQQVTPLALAENIPVDITIQLEKFANYQSLFEQAFGSEDITAARIGMAIATYERTLIADQTPWDKFIAGDTTAMTAEQVAGWEMFEESTVCDNCHKPPLFTDNKFYNIGLRPAQEDIGRQEVTQNIDDFGRFKTPSLRNSGLRKSLMHTGWVLDTRDAIDFYNALADEDNGIENPHQQFIDNQSGIPTTNENMFVDYHTLSMASQSEATKNNVAEFIANGLTDPRVANEEFPFDRPILASERKLHTSTEVSFLTYNIAGANWQSHRASLISDTINSNLPSVIGLQEAGQTPLNELIPLISDHYKMINLHDSRIPILFDSTRLNLIVSGSTETNQMLWCVNDSYINYAIFSDKSTGSQFIFTNSHFCSQQTQNDRLPSGYTAAQVNEQHAEILVELIYNLSTGWQLPFVIAGDLNASTNTTTMQFLLEQVSLPSGITNKVTLDDTWNAVNDGNKSGVDWLLYNNTNNLVVSAQRIENDITTQASDHYPVLANIIFNTQNNDIDSDGDGFNDSIDVFPQDPSEWLDTDEDNVGNNSDIDDDNDGVLDGQDAFPLDVNESVDTDSDGVGNNSDTDDDNDGVFDIEDAFPLDTNENTDTDSDGVGNNSDTDDDNDGVFDIEDAFPLDTNENTDTDSDGVGNNSDTDDDNDGVFDTEDVFPLDANESVDTDSDGVGNNSDTDDDNDGVFDFEDAFPLDVNESVDTDSDGVGNNSDTDDDNDGIFDTEDVFPLEVNQSTATAIQADTQSSSGGSMSMFTFVLLLWISRRRWHTFL